MGRTFHHRSARFARHFLEIIARSTAFLRVWDAGKEQIENCQDFFVCTLTAHCKYITSIPFICQGSEGAVIYSKAFYSPEGKTAFLVLRGASSSQITYTDMMGSKLMLVKMNLSEYSWANLSGMPKKSKNTRRISKVAGSSICIGR